MLLLDVQATSGDPARGAMLEMAWAPFAAGEAGGLPHDRVTAHVIAPPPGAVLPRAVARITGLRTADWTRGIAPGQAWDRLRHAVLGLSPRGAPAPAVIHFARFEEPLPAGAARALTGAGRSRSISSARTRSRDACSGAAAAHAARAGRLLRGGRAAARRSADHVVATAFVWQQLVALLAEREGIVGRPDLDDWLARPARRTPRVFPLARERRRELPDRPGVYRLLRAGGTVLYVGKAASLRQRVSGHFHAHAGQGERALEMLTQVRDVSWSVTETALEAALLEADEIKRLCSALQRRARRRRALGLVRDPRPRRAAGAAGPRARLRAVRVAGSARGVGGAARCCSPTRCPAPLATRARAVGTEPGYAPGPECFAAGLSHVPRSVRFGRARAGTAPARRAALGAPARGSRGRSRGRFARGSARGLGAPPPGLGRGARGRWRWRKRCCVPPTRSDARAGSSG